MTDKKLPAASGRTAPSKLSEAERIRIAREVLAEYLEGGKIADSAAKRGLSTSRVYGLLVRHAEQEFKDAQVAAALEGMEAAEALIASSAGDYAKLGAGRELLKSAQWKLERLFRRMYGQSDPASAVTPVIIMIPNLRSEAGPAPRVIEARRCDTDADG